ncbi:MAG TPA: zf-HC2 domain-containing protein [Streptosporangiaceae bacterium]|nr:zf-HC2 domain-containing protein [Streptosporangiaceae bacterium]
MDECTSVRNELGVYLVGAITPADRARVARHLPCCERCRDEVAGLAALPGLLRRQPAEPGEPAMNPDPPGAFPGSLASRVARRRRTRLWLTTAAVTSLAAAAGAGWATAARNPPPGRAPAAALLGTRRIGGVRVLTDAQGLTVYWFAPDKGTASLCAGTCAAQWPPVPGPVHAGAGVPGTLGTITRPDGMVQATWDGHPLYTATLDTTPGQANGNNLDISGGIWHECAAAELV